MKYKFKWEKWIDPLKPSDFKNDPDDESDDPTFKVLPTPFGMLSITNHALASTKFDFWLLHTNFKLTNEIASVMEQVDGVETINVLTRYRCRFGFPKSGLFDTSCVKEAIERNVLKALRIGQDHQLRHFDQNTLQKAIEVRDSLDEHNEHWALYVLPNGHMEIIKEKVMQDHLFQEKLDLLKTVHELVGGTILTSDEA